MNEKKATFKTMAEGTREDYQLIEAAEKTYWIVKHHTIFQGYYFWHHLGGDRNARDKYRDHPWFDACAEFCEKFDQNAFDDDYDTLPLEFFQPMVERIFSRTAFADHV